MLNFENIYYFTFGFVNLNNAIAADKTKERSPKVKAFHVLRAIKANANGTITEALNFSPKTKGITTFFTKLDLPTTS